MNLKDSKMSFFEHLNELKKRLVWIFATVFGIALFCFTFNFKSFNFFALKIPYPYPTTENSIAIWFFNKIVSDLVPSRVDLIVTKPTDALVAILEISLFLGIVLGMPMIIYQIGRFVSPGLYPHEKKLILLYAIPSALLFAIGCAFSYFLILPFTFEFLYDFAVPIRAVSYLNVNSLISFVLLFSIGFGIGFELPVIMVGLTHLGVFSSEFWKEYWRYAVIAIVIFAGIITPDTSGITQLMVAFPMILLYGIGYIVSKKVEKKSQV